MTPLHFLASFFARARSACRLSLRASVAVPARMTVAGANELARTNVVLENLSVGGTLMRSAEPLREGDRVRLTIRAGCIRRFKIAGEVVYARTKRFEAESLYGLHFVDATEEQRIALASYVDELRQGELIRLGLLSVPNAAPIARPAACPCGCGGKWSGR